MKVRNTTHKSCESYSVNKQAKKHTALLDKIQSTNRIIRRICDVRALLMLHDQWRRPDVLVETASQSGTCQLSIIRQPRPPSKSCQDEVNDLSAHAQRGNIVPEHRLITYQQTSSTLYYFTDEKIDYRLSVSLVYQY